jgi:hypothetical protein
LSEGAAVTYRNLILAAFISSPGHPVWQWLAKRSGRIAGLRLELSLAVPGDYDYADDEEEDGEDSTEGTYQLPDWTQPLQTLSGIPDVELKVEWLGGIADLDHPCIALWLKQYGQLISHLTVEVHVSTYMLKLREFTDAASPCRSIDLTIRHYSSQAIDLADLEPVACSLKRFMWWHGSLRGATVFTGMTQLVHLDLPDVVFRSEEPWGLLANVTTLQGLHLGGSASGDPSPLSALTGLSFLSLESSQFEADDQTPFSFSSLPPLSTLQQLECLHLESHACAATSLQGLAGLSNLRVLELELEADEGRLRSLEGISPRVVEVSVHYAPNLVSLAGMEGCISLVSLTLGHCGVSSLQPLRGLTSMTELKVYDCCLTSLEGFASMSLQSISLKHCRSLTQLDGVQHLSALKSLVVAECGVTSLHPLSELGEGLQRLCVIGCKRVLEEVLELPHVQPTIYLNVSDSNVKEVVVAGLVKPARIGEEGRFLCL